MAGSEHTEKCPHVRRGMTIRCNDLNINHMDPPVHGRFRRMLAPRFMMKKINEQREDLQKIVDQAIDRLLTFEKPVNFHEEFALVIPSTVICRVLGTDYSHHEVSSGSRASSPGPTPPPRSWP